MTSNSKIQSKCNLVIRFNIAAFQFLTQKILLFLLQEQVGPDIKHLGCITNQGVDL